MMTHSRWLTAVAAAACAAVVLTASRPADAADAVKDSDAFFASKDVVSLAIDLDKKELESLRREPRKYVKAKITENGKAVFVDVGVHVKGAAGSTRGIDDKPGVTINMDKFGGSALFHGMDKWHLANSVQDPSYLSELICGELYRGAGVPASRVTHALVSIDGKKRGLYYLKEGYDKYFRKRHFPDPNGRFYDGGFLRDVDQQLQLLSGTEGPKKQPELAALVAASRERKPEERFAKLSKLLDMDKFVTYLCLQVLTWDWDGYPMNRNNYRVYYDPKADKVTFVPSGMDQMWGDPGGTMFPNFNGMVASAVMSAPEGKKRYVARMEEILDKKVYDPEGMVKRLDELEKRIQPVLAKADPGAGQGYAGQVRRLKDAIPARAKSVREQLKRMKK